jgi:hypothetical protein
MLPEAMHVSWSSREKCDPFPSFRGTYIKYYGGGSAKSDEGRGQKKEKGDPLMSRQIIGDSRCTHTAEQRGKLFGKQPVNDNK